MSGVMRVGVVGLAAIRLRVASELDRGIEGLALEAVCVRNAVEEKVVKKRILDPEKMDSMSIYKIIAGAIVPRPIGFISTISTDNVRNAAPFSFFNGISDVPPLVCLSISRHNSNDRQKDTLKNIVDTGEFVANIVDEGLATAQDICAREFPPEVDEFEMAGISSEESVRIRAPCIKESLVNFECRVVQVIPLPESRYTLVIGRICMMHIHPEVLMENGRISLERLRPIGRLIGNAYCHTNDQFALTHDTLAQPGIPSGA
jgi:flavin reductase (DIM6/NTAB) family NADH-FMN oxidoreductase RutF